MKALLTGFNPFGGLTVNPSEKVVQQFRERRDSVHGMEWVTEILPTEFDRAGSLIRGMIRQWRPERIVCLGVGGHLTKIHLERIALNLDDAEIADNAGVTRRGETIVPGAPLAYASTLPIDRIHAALVGRGIPVAISNHAGSYVCNHVFYVARHEVELLGLKAACGFVHLPPLIEASPGASSTGTGLGLETMIEAVAWCLKES